MPRLWRLDRSADYGVLNGLARNRIDRALIARNWDDLLRLAGSLKMSAVGAVELLHSLQDGGRLFRMAAGSQPWVARYRSWARGPKTLHLLSYFDDEEHRRYIGRHLTRHVSRHKLARTIFHGRKMSTPPALSGSHGGSTRRPGPGRQCDVLWTTLYMDRALAQLVAKVQRSTTRTWPASRRWARTTSTSWGGITFHCRTQSPVVSFRPCAILPTSTTRTR
jgi:TnpA family transposase